MKRTGMWVLLVFGTVGISFAQQKFSLEDYLGQVKAKGQGYQSAQASVEGLEKQSHQQDLTYSPVLTASYNHLDDQSQQVFAILGTHNQTDSAGVSISDKFPFGPTLSLGYAFDNTNYSGPSLASSVP